MADPWFRATVVDGSVRVAGDLSAGLGRPVESSTGRPGGVYAGWRWDGRELVAWNDPLGFYPLFYAVDNAGVWLSPSPLAMVRQGASPTLDPDALGVFARLGFFLGNDTPFAAIRSLPPGGRLRWAAAAPTVHGGETIVPARDIRREQAIDGLIELFRAAVARQAPCGPSTVSLSGGRDSRHILLELHARGTPPALCVTGRKFPPDSGDDVRIARHLALRASVEHRVVGRARPRFHAERSGIALQGYCSGEGSWFLPVARGLRRVNGPVWYGIGGNLLVRSRFDSVSAQDIQRGRWESLADRVLREGRRDECLERLRLPAHFAGLLDRERAVGRLARELARHAGAASPLTSFGFWNRTRRADALIPYRLMADRDVLAPFLDLELFELMSSLPDALRSDGALHREAMRRAYPAFAGIPFQSRPRGRPNGPRFYAHWLRYTADFGWHVATERSQRLWANPAVRSLPVIVRRRGGATAAHRLAPLVLYLLQLESAIGVTSPRRSS